MAERMLKVYIGGYIGVDLQQISAPHQPVSMLTVYKEKTRRPIYKAQSTHTLPIDSDYSTTLSLPRVSMTTVAIVKGTNPQDMTVKALETVLGEPIEKMKKKFRTSFSSRFLVHLG